MTSSATIDYTAAGTGAVTRSVEAKLRETVSVTDFGAAGDGSSDDTAEIQAAIDALPVEGGVLIFPEGDYLIGAQITESNKSFTLRFEGARFTASADLKQAHWFHFTDCNVIIEGDGSFEGNETLSQFNSWVSGGGTVNYTSIFAIFRFTNGTHRISGIKGLRNSVTGASHRCLIRFEDCTDNLVRECAHTGFCNADTAIGPDPGYNTIPMILDRGGSRNTVRDCWAYQCGDLVIAQAGTSDTSHGKVIGGGGRYLKDNGVYVSNGDWMIVAHTAFRDVYGTGVKMRGSHNKALFNNIRGCILGISMTDRSGGADCRDIKVIGNTIDDYETAVEVSMNSSIYPSDVEVASNTILNQDAGADVTTEFPIEIVGANNLNIHDNVIDGVVANYAGLVTGEATGTRADGVKVNNNTLKNCTGDGFLIRYASTPIVTGNSAEAGEIGGGDLIRFQDSDDGYVAGNAYPGGNVVAAVTGELTGKCLVTGNRGTIGISAGQRNVADRPVVYDNADEILLGSVAVTPGSIPSAGTSPFSTTVTGLTTSYKIEAVYGGNLANCDIYTWPATNTVNGYIVNHTGSSRTPDNATIYFVCKRVV